MEERKGGAHHDVEVGDLGVSVGTLEFSLDVERPDGRHLVHVLRSDRLRDLLVKASVASGVDEVVKVLLGAVLEYDRLAAVALELGDLTLLDLDRAVDDLLRAALKDKEDVAKSAESEEGQGPERDEQC